MRSRTVESAMAILSSLGLLAASHCHAAREDGDRAALGRRELGIELRPPKDHSLLIDIPAYRAPRPSSPTLDLYAYEYAAHVYSAPERRARTLGLVRRGTVQRAAKRVAAPGCKGGPWYALRSAGYACVGKGFTVTRPSIRQRRPDLSRPLPFRYGRVNTRDALRYYRMPAEAEEQQSARMLAARKPLPDVVEKQLDGDYFVAIDRVENDGARSFYRTVLGRYVRTDQVDIKPEPPMRGQLLNQDMSLPLAFVYGEPQAPVFARVEGETRIVGTAYKHARFTVQRTAHWTSRETLVSSRGYGVERKHVRVARRRARPSAVNASTRWIHVDLDEQTLVAYQGDRPVFATLVSTGREGYDTPAGFFRIHEKHKTVTMRGADPVDGPFEVSEVPWTMYYSGSYALHGAYWHNDFGKTRSHGCTNLSPIDARWLFEFTRGEIPAGWHARRQLEGTPVYLTRDSST